VKVPVSDSKGVFSGPVISSLSALGVKLNITAVLTHKQADKALGVLNGKGHIVSVFAGRIADTGRNPHHTVSTIAMSAHRTGNRVLWASAREVLNVVQAEELSCDIITLTPELIAKLDGFGRDLEEYSIATVRQFYEDARGIKLCAV
jgi:transaldolase